MLTYFLTGTRPGPTMSAWVSAIGGRPVPNGVGAVDIEVSVPGGRVRGLLRDGVVRFLSMPYAAPPVGPLRFQAPQPVIGWDGVRDATAWGPTAPKPQYRAPFDTLLVEPEIPGDDYLTVNVWAPAGAQPGDRLPVMVWIHGGAFGNGASAVSAMDGHNFARDGVVLVSLNYRLGIEGFACLPDAPANRGLLDQIGALQWVRDTIATFGGDPGNVTVFGESAGAMSITTLLAMPRARGLFHKVITQSGSLQAIARPEDAAYVNSVLSGLLGCDITATSLSALDPAVLLAAQRTLTNDLDDTADVARFSLAIVASRMPFIPILDGDTIPVAPAEAIAAGAGAHLPLLTGTNLEENRLFMVPTDGMEMVTDEVFPGFAAMMGIPDGVISTYRASRPGATSAELLEALTSDSFFRLPALAVADARVGSPAPTYVYEFMWRSPQGNLGACHFLDVAFVFDNLADPANLPVTGPNPPQALASAMHAAWIRFARNGDPGWPRYGSDRLFMIFDGADDRVVADHRRDERLAWSAPLSV